MKNNGLDENRLKLYMSEFRWCPRHVEQTRNKKAAFGVEVSALPNYGGQPLDSRTKKEATKYDNWQRILKNRILDELFECMCLGARCQLVAAPALAFRTNHWDTQPENIPKSDFYICMRQFIMPSTLILSKWLCCAILSMQKGIVGFQYSKTAFCSMLIIRMDLLDRFCRLSCLKRATTCDRLWPARAFFANDAV